MFAYLRLQQPGLLILTLVIYTTLETLTNDSRKKRPFPEGAYFLLLL
jgi:hypothetical protein